MNKTPPVTLGITRLLKCERKLLEGARIGLIANSASINELGIPSAAALLNDSIELKCLFSPEHGYDVAARPGEKVADAVDPATGLPIISLYGGSRKPGEEALRDLDALVFDLQDVGVRCYTYIWTMALAMEAAATYGKLFVVLDRPNPLDGIQVQGPVLDERFASFLGLYSIPLRHGMTIGELALLFNQVYGIEAQLAVVKMHGWRRRLMFSETRLRWAPPSPAIISPETALVYAGTCLFEGTNISEGRGTASPFRLIGAPWLDAGILGELEKQWTAGFALSPQKFTPVSSKYEGEECIGIAVKVVEREAADPIALMVEMLSKIALRHPESIEWREPHFDMVAGTDSLRRAIQNGRETEHILQSWKQNLREYEDLRTKYFLYEG
jgi:uncharacterized protein YbbC (DUF1343 family)